MTPATRLDIIGVLCSVMIFACTDTASTGSGTGGTPADSGAESDRGRRDSGSTPDGADTVSSDDIDEDGAAIEDGQADSPIGDTGSPSEDAALPRDGQLVPDPTSVYLSVPAIGASLQQVIIIRNETTVEVTIHSVEVVSGSTGFSLLDAPVEEVRGVGASVGFTLQYTAETDSDVMADVVVYHDFGDPLIIPVVVAAKVEDGDACINVSPARLNFGTVTRGDPVVFRTFTISHCGGPTVRVLRLDRGRVFGLLPTPAEFQWTADRALPITLAPTQTADVQVTFSPGRAGRSQGAINVISNVSGSETTTVNLDATAEPPPIGDLDLHLILEWVNTPSDVDFHFIATGDDIFTDDDCYFSNMTPDWGVAGDITDDPFLDYDDLTSGGPEQINVDELQAGSYDIVVHYYSDTGTGGGDYGSSTDADATVQVYINGTRRATYGPVNLEATGHVWNVARIDWAGDDGTLTELGDRYWR